VPDDLEGAVRHRVRGRCRAGWSKRAARRQKWIDQAQSLNIYMAGASGKKLDDTYKLAWLRGLKTTYYLRTLGATSAEKSTGRAGQLNAVSADGASTEEPQTKGVLDTRSRVRGLPVTVKVNMQLQGGIRDEKIRQERCS